MRQWQIRNYDLGGLEMAEAENPAPGPEQILVKVGAVSLNYRDKLAITGKFGEQQSLPLVPCSDAAGVVAALGSRVKRFEVGDRVTSHFAPEWLYGNARPIEQS